MTCVTLLELMNCLHTGKLNDEFTLKTLYIVKEFQTVEGKNVASQRSTTTKSSLHNIQGNVLLQRYGLSVLHTS